MVALQSHGQRANVLFGTLRLLILWRLLTQQFRQFPLDQLQNSHLHASQRNIANWPLIIFSYQSLWSPLVLYVQKHSLFLVNLDVAYLQSLVICAKQLSFFSVYPQPFNVLTVFYLKVLLLMAKMCRRHFYLNDLDQC